MTALIGFSLPVPFAILAWLTVRDVDALPKLWRRIKLNPVAKAWRAAWLRVTQARVKGLAAKTETERQSGFKVRGRRSVEAASSVSRCALRIRDAVLSMLDRVDRLAPELWEAE